MNTLTTQILQKFALLLQLAGNEATEKLNTELAKIMPQNETANIQLKIGWGYNNETQTIQTSISFIVSPLLTSQNTKGEPIKSFEIQDNQNLSIKNKLENIIRYVTEPSLNKLNEGLDTVLEGKNTEFGFVPPIILDDKTGFFILNIRAKYHNN